MSALTDRIALVTGASRGAGRGIASVLGEWGATVIVTGRSMSSGTRTDDLPGTIDGTAREVTKRGGTGIAIRCDHTEDREVQDVFERIRSEFGGLDILVNNVWGGYESYDNEEFSSRFWDQPLHRWEDMFEAGVRAHFHASSLAAKLMIPRKRGLIVNTSFWDDDKYLSNLYYDVAKHAINRMAYGMAIELKDYGIAALALSPGFMRTERVMEAHEREPFDLDQTESTEYIGRAVAHLAADPNIMTHSGRTLRVGDLAAEYGFTDIDGRTIEGFIIPDPGKVL